MIVLTNNDIKNLIIEEVNTRMKRESAENKEYTIEKLIDLAIEWDNDGYIENEEDVELLIADYFEDEII